MLYIGLVHQADLIRVYYLDIYSLISIHKYLLKQNEGLFLIFSKKEK